MVLLVVSLLLVLADISVKARETVRIRSNGHGSRRHEIDGVWSARATTLVPLSFFEGQIYLEVRVCPRRVPHSVSFLLCCSSSSQGPGRGGPVSLFYPRLERLAPPRVLTELLRRGVAAP